MQLMMRDLRPTNCTLTVALGTYHFFSSYILQRSPGRQINTAFLQEKGEKMGAVLKFYRSQNPTIFKCPII